MAVREQSLMSDVDARDSFGRAQERGWRGASGRSRPTHQEQIRRAVRDARRDQLRRGAESLVRLGVAAIAALLIARLVALPLHATLPPGLVEWIGRLSAPLLARSAARFLSVGKALGFLARYVGSVLPAWVLWLLWLLALLWLLWLLLSILLRRRGTVP